MTAEIRMDLSELARLAEDLHGAAARMNAAVVPVMKRAGVNVKKDARARAQEIQSVLTTIPAYPYSIGYDVFVGPVRVVTEVGPDKDKAQGPLGNLLEYGSSNNPPYPHLAPAGEAEAPRLQKNLVREAVKAVLGQ